jgi:small neutral amino acid transporter SnatA (MarC family)
MFFSERLRGFLGERGVYAMERLMGMLLTIISVQLFMNGVKQFMAW